MTNDEATTAPGEAATEAHPGKPPIVDVASWQAARGSLLAQKNHTRASE